MLNKYNLDKYNIELVPTSNPFYFNIKKDGTFRRILDLSDIEERFIEKETFKDCAHLWEVILPKNLLYVDEDTFKYCASLKKIKFNENLRVIKKNAFAYCQLLEEIVLPDNLLCIEDNAFEGCWNLHTVILNERLKEIGHNVFDNCYIKTIILPKSLERLPEDFLDNQQHNEKITVFAPDNIYESVCEKLDSKRFCIKKDTIDDIIKEASSFKDINKYKNLKNQQR